MGMSSFLVCPFTRTAAQKASGLPALVSMIGFPFTSTAKPAGVSLMTSFDFMVIL